ncbi:MAG: hypothetical protein KGL75_10280 [Acidobacteriota bacterium]|nr:hypothetical protein [Acidobacteriota bacterium]
MTPAYSFFHWLTQTYIGREMQGNAYLFPTVEALHIMGSVALVGATSIISLRLAGLFLTEVPISKVAKQFLPWAWLGFGFQVVTGILLFMSEATLAYDNAIFQVKMALIVFGGIVALVFQQTVYRRVKSWDVTNPPFSAKFAGYTLIVVWFAVIAAGRWLNSSVANAPLPPPP